jgi:branched-chain amino acid transport system ATP-binding protein
MSRLDVKDLKVVYGPVVATHDVSFSVQESEITALIGSNGAGKSSTLKAIMGMARLGEGEIWLDGNRIDGKRPYEIVRAGVGLSPEGRRVFSTLTVLDNLMAGAHVLDREAVPKRLEQVFTYFPRLQERARQLAGSLSGGEQQMLALGRALMSRPRLLLLDEPSLGLAPIVIERIGELVRAIQSQEKLTVIVAEQNANWALRLASRGIVLEVGSIKLTGDSQSLRSDNYVRRAYLGT